VVRDFGLFKVSGELMNDGIRVKKPELGWVGLKWGVLDISLRLS
jgi:hypothetical protein